jgi:hypothetical protein
MAGKNQLVRQADVPTLIDGGTAGIMVQEHNQSQRQG